MIKSVYKNDKQLDKLPDGRFVNRKVTVPRKIAEGVFQTCHPVFVKSETDGNFYLTEWLEVGSDLLEIHSERVGKTKPKRKGSKADDSVAE